jgi:hypothetical protein
VELLGADRRRYVGLACRYAGRQVQPGHARVRFDPVTQCVRAEPGGRDARPHGTRRTQVAGQRPRVHTRERGHPRLFQIACKRPAGAPVAVGAAQLPDHEASHLDPLRFAVLRADAVVPDQRVGHDHYLAGVRWIGQHFLVTGHRRTLPR